MKVSLVTSSIAMLIAASAQPAQGQDQTRAPDENQRICRVVPSTGWRLQNSRVCRTRAEWAALQRENDDETRELNRRRRGQE